MGQSKGSSKEKQAEEPEQTWTVYQLFQEIVSTVIPVCHPTDK